MGQAWGSDAVHPQEAQPLEVIIVTSPSDSRDLLELSPESSPWSTEKISLDFKDTQNLSLQDLLERQSSIQLKSMGGRASFSTLSIRGSSSSQVKIFIDGQEINNGQSAQVDLSTLSLQQFERIEIYKSHAPARFGVSPLGGVINLVTRRESDHLGDVKLGVGSFGYYDGLVNAYFKNNKFSNILQFEHEQEQGNFKYTDDNLSPDNNSDDVEKTRSNADFASYRALWSGKYQINKDSQWDWKLGAFTRDKGLPGPAKFQTKEVRYKENQAQLGLGYHQADLLAKDGTTHFSTSYLNQNDQYLDPRAELGPGNPQKYKYQGDTSDLGMIHQQSFKLMLSSFNLKARRENFQSKDEILQQSFPKSQRQQFDYGLDNNIPLGKSPVELTLGWMGTSVDNELKQNNSNTSSPQSGYDFFNTWNSGLLWHVTSTLDARTGYSKTLRLPTMGELYGDRGVTVGNDQLESEKADNMDIGLQWQPTGEWGMWHHNSLGATLFRSERHRLIAMEFDARGIGRASNLGEGEANGLEVQTSSQFGSHLTLSQNFTWMDTELKNPLIATGSGKAIPGVAEWSWAPRMVFQWGAWSVGYDVLVEQNTFFDRANVLKAADKELHHADIKWRRKKLQIAFDIHNLTDEKVNDFNDWPRPGRSYALSLLTSF